MESKLKANQNVHVEIINKPPQYEIKPESKVISEAYLCRKKAKYGVRNCRLTGEEFIPMRKNQWFANAQNRIEYYNNKANDFVEISMREIKLSSNFDNQIGHWKDVFFYIASSQDKSEHEISNHFIQKYRLIPKVN